MEIQEIAEKLVYLCRRGKSIEAINTLYSEDAISIECEDDEIMKGKEKLIEKNNFFNHNFDAVQILLADPIVAGNHFSTNFKMEVIHNESGETVYIDEIALYEVEDGKIIKEQFFYEIEEEYEED